MTALSLILSISSAFFMPTIDGARQTLPYIEVDLPYVLGISVPPPGIADLLVTQGDNTLWSGISQGTFDICTITSSTPILLYEDGVLEYTIIAEPVTIWYGLTCLPLVHMLRTCRRKWKG